MSLSTRLDKLEAAMRGRDGGDPPDGPWICRRLIYDPLEWVFVEDEAVSRLKGGLSEIDRERISRMQTDELDRLVAAGEIREIDREHVTFIVRTIVDPPEWPDDPRSPFPDLTLARLMRLPRHLFLTDQGRKELDLQSHTSNVLVLVLVLDSFMAAS